MGFFDYGDRLFRKKVRMAQTRGWSVLGRDGVYFSQLSVREAPRIWIVDAHRDGMRFIVRADEKLTAFLEPEAAIPSRNQAHEQKSIRSVTISAGVVRLDTTEKLGIVSDRQRLVA